MARNVIHMKHTENAVHNSKIKLNAEVFVGK